MICPRCGLEVEVDPNDIRPWLYHWCPDLVGKNFMPFCMGRNPVFWDRRDQYPTSIEGNYRYRTWRRNLGHV